jgi:hypothetical protein
MRARSASKGTGPPPAKRIAAQLASRAPKTVSQLTHSEVNSVPYEQASNSRIDPYDDRGVEIDRERSDDTVFGRYEDEDDNLDFRRSSTEPESHDEDAKRLWEERQERKEWLRHHHDRRVMNQEGERRYEPDGERRDANQHPMRNGGQGERYSQSRDRRDQWEIHQQDGRRNQNRQDEEGGQYHKHAKTGEKPSEFVASRLSVGRQMRYICAGEYFTSTCLPGFFLSAGTRFAVQSNSPQVICISATNAGCCARSETQGVPQISIPAATRNIFRVQSFAIYQHPVDER